MSYEQRECRSCYGCGTVIEFVNYDDETGELAQEVFDCFTCGGAGVITVYVYDTTGERKAT